MRAIRSAAMFTLAIAATSVYAWNAEGHRQVADIAWQLLKPETRQKVAKILAAGDKLFQPKDNTMESAREAFRYASTWPDVIKGNRRTDFEMEIETFNGKWKIEIKEGSNEGERCKTWHYYDVPIRYKGKVPDVQESNGVNATNFALTELTRLNKAKTDLRMQAWWLVWLEHIVGDLHQPLHCVSNYERHEHGDDGGNGYTLGVNGRNGRPLRLHAYWDEGIDHAKAAEAEGRGSTSIEAVTERWLAEAATKPSLSELKILDPMSWVKAGAAIADKSVYTGIKDITGFVPDSTYEKEHQAISKKGAILAGYRLALLIERALND